MFSPSTMTDAQAESNNPPCMMRPATYEVHKASALDSFRTITLIGTFDDEESARDYAEHYAAAYGKTSAVSVLVQKN